MQSQQKQINSQTAHAKVANHNLELQQNQILKLTRQLEAHMNPKPQTLNTKP